MLLTSVSTRMLDIVLLVREDITAKAAIRNMFSEISLSAATTKIVRTSSKSVVENVGINDFAIGIA